MTNNVDNITEGQASCLVLSFPPTEKNRAKAKRMFKDSPFTVSYIKGTDPLFPIAIGRKTQKLNPFKYLSYPSTPPLIDESLPIFDETISDQDEAMMSDYDDDGLKSEDDTHICNKNETVLDDNMASDNSEESKHEEEESTPENDETTSEREKSIPENDKSNSEIKEEENEDNYKIQYPVEGESTCYFLVGKNSSYKTTLMNVESDVEENTEDIALQQQREAEERKKRDEIIEEELNRIKVKKEKLLEQSLEQNDLFAIDDSYDLDNIIYNDDQSENEGQETSEFEAVIESPGKVSEIAVNGQYETPETTVVNENEQRSEVVINEDEDTDVVTIQNEDENSVVSTPSHVKKKKVNIKILKSSVLAFSTKIFAKKTPEFPERYDYIFVSTVDMLDYIGQHIDVGDLSSKRYQYWLSKSNLLSGKVENFQNDEGTAISGRYLYVLKPQFRKKILRRQRQQDRQQETSD